MIHSPRSSDDRLAIGIDLGTSGVRAVAIDTALDVVATASAALPPSRRDGAAATQSPDDWWNATWAVLAGLCAGLGRRGGRVAAIAVDGTSGSLLLTDARLRPLTPGLMYDDTSCADEAARVAAIVPEDSAARGPASPLARLLRWQATPGAAHVLHQADWITARLRAEGATDLPASLASSDENNALKLGYDPVARDWPGWFDALGVRRALLPAVRPPGSAIGAIAPELAMHMGLSPEVLIAAGTTDGVAAFLATGACEPGDAVSSLGSTLVLKLLTDRPVNAPAFGVYSHRLGDMWLVGGASNSGGAALLRHFSVGRMRALEAQLRPGHPTGLDYYPLAGTGERFPFADPDLVSRDGPRPISDATHFQALLEGIAAIEGLGYRRLGELGAITPTRVFSVGGGAANAAWQDIRAQHLGVPVIRSRHADAAVGAARLALAALPPHEPDGKGAGKAPTVPPHQ
ncbi:FGGY-family carbohydrate kinase [Derxia gummosa]|uniref:FGGY-family carbohydrate kinase n=1 Tax=Derxia gummosa DSM 723 TaxID=1121388 RepID=A0A9U5C4G9_9BURK|nr:FGGY-family carbohydrate kinase [Derxia gummosa]